MSKKLPIEVVYEVRDNCLCLATQRAARRLARRFDRAFAPVGLTNGQFSLMMALNAPQAPTVGKLAAFLAMDRTTLTAALKSLERRGLVRVAADETDKRARRVALTEAGRETLVSALPIWRATHAAVEKELPEGDAERLRLSLANVCR
ncbi:MarR family winged helix-turn-helix transcriptional regulator [Methylocystis parvus]|uniref:Winged helix-turn-helix transcriptional regulator n=1 Tax=Methylocystis parvus TaxID=134 RepID=A0A6B8M6F8_9HYPH|nr:MarR family winged helix-turn-helix transcriptional regulator [Methylocystis parvus]QGM98481.1 winged helix-turn-helix transcriptional regulator [Methylocystis parvus]WBK01182.1 MarR family winged helix-turn-helix transcriptional regulator [Methylocystis parvus OBBP]